jgi:hypothetical protein
MSHRLQQLAPTRLFLHQAWRSSDNLERSLLGCNPEAKTLWFTGATRSMLFGRRCLCPLG